MRRNDLQRPATAGEALPISFFQRETLTVARELIGARLCRRFADGRTERFPIHETEAYDGPDDRASHAHKGRTPRTEVMFAPGGIWYVYLCYGVHWMVNVVTGPRDYPAAVLLRGAGSVSGPGRLTRALEIDKALNETPATPASGLWIEQGVPVPTDRIRSLPRVGIAYAGPECAAKPYRFVQVSTIS